MFITKSQVVGREGNIRSFWLDLLEMTKYIYIYRSWMRDELDEGRFRLL